MKDFQEGFVDVWLTLEAVLDLVDIVDGVVELHRLVVLNGWPSGGPAKWRVELHGRGARRGVRRDGRIALTARCQHLGLKRLGKATKIEVLGVFHQMLHHKTLDLFRCRRCEDGINNIFLVCKTLLASISHSPCSSWQGWAVAEGAEQ